MEENMDNELVPGYVFIVGGENFGSPNPCKQ